MTRDGYKLSLAKTFGRLFYYVLIALVSYAPGYSRVQSFVRVLLAGKMAWMLGYVFCFVAVFRDTGTLAFLERCGVPGGSCFCDGIERLILCSGESMLYLPHFPDEYRELCVELRIENSGVHALESVNRGTWPSLEILVMNGNIFMDCYSVVERLKQELPSLNVHSDCMDEYILTEQGVQMGTTSVDTSSRGLLDLTTPLQVTSEPIPSKVPMT